MRRAIPVLLGLAAMAWCGGAFAESRALKDFFGDYIGRSISHIGEGLSERDLSVTIRAFKKKGFTVDWTTVSRKSDGRTTSKSYSVNFLPVKRKGMFASAMRNDMFGKPVPLDPIKGDPYLWARIGGETLTVYALLIVDQGGYEMQVYERTLTADGLALRFSRVRNGHQLKLITGTLKKVSK